MPAATTVLNSRSSSIGGGVCEGQLEEGVDATHHHTRLIKQPGHKHRIVKDLENGNVADCRNDTGGREVEGMKTTGP